MQRTTAKFIRKIQINLVIFKQGYERDGLTPSCDKMQERATASIFVVWINCRRPTSTAQKIPKHVKSDLVCTQIRWTRHLDKEFPLCFLVEQLAPVSETLRASLPLLEALRSGTAKFTRSCNHAVRSAGCRLSVS
jgi:hypothetical protein